MNRYFKRGAENEPPPTHLLGQLESIEPRGSRGVLLTFDAVPLDWARQMLRQGAFEALNQERIALLLEEIPLFHFEMKVHPKSMVHRFFESRWINREGGVETTAALGQWFELLFYESAFGNDRGYASSTVSGVRGHLDLIPSAEHELTGLLDLIVPEVTPVTSSSPQLLDTLSSIECPAVLAVLDVGQGSANVMQNERCEPLLYFDVGRGVRADTATTQLPLEFCICGPRETRPPVLISHWHEDHYEGANDDTDLYLCTWITPQALTLKHKSIQQNALNQGSTVLELLPGFPDFQFGATSNFTLTYCTGPATNLNHCGHALLVEREDKNWLLPADAAYKFICFAMDRAFTAVAATHHGAKFSGSAPLKAGGYARLVYSFGPDNSYKHPKTSSISKHTGKFWNHGFVGGWPAPIGALPPVPNGEVRSTAAHAPASLHLGSVVIGWNAPPPLAVPPYQCPRCGKSFNILQN